LSTVEPVEKRCPRCGHLDVGHYCSNCSYPLDQERPSVYREMFHSFFLKFLTENSIARFLRTLWLVLRRPGGINLQKTYAPGARYMSDLGFAKVIFFLALGSTILKLFASPTEGQIDKLIENWFFQTYVLWFFCFSLLAFIWIGRTWKKFMRYEVEDQRQYDSMYIYEYGLLVTVIYVLSLFYGSEIEQMTYSAMFPDVTSPAGNTDAWPSAGTGVEPFTAELKTVGWILLAVFVIRFFWFHLALAYRANLPGIRTFLITLVCLYFLIFYVVAAEFLTIPIALLPILYLLSPVYYLAQGIMKKFWAQ